MSLPMYCAAPGLCFPTVLDWAAMGVAALGWGFVLFMKWVDPARPAVEQITGKPWWRNW